MEQGEVAVMLAEMQQCLQREGLGAEASSFDRLAVLWRLYQEKENTVRTLTQEIQELRAERAAEIKTVQQYVENIRSLSKTRDSMALELEQDNEMLRTKLDDITLQQEAQKSEIAEMLLQEGLAEVIPSSLSEQVAYLLAERASLLEKRQEAVDTNALQKCAQNTSPQSSEENPDKVESLRGQSPWKRLLGIRKAAQTRQIFTPVVNEGSGSGENALKERERWLLERDLDEASSRLDMAHREIRRLTDELESARLTQRAYEPELQEAQLEVEQLRQEVEKLKRCDVAELRRAKEMNEALDAEVRQLRDSVHRMQTERFQLLELIDFKIEDLDSEDDEDVQAFFQKLTKSRVASTGSLSKSKKRKEKDVHKRCCTELEDQKQAVLKLQTELEEERMLQKKTVEECNDHSKRRVAAEQLNVELRALCEQKEEEHKTRVQQLQEKLASLNAELGQLKSALHKQCEQARQQHMALQAQADRAKVLSQSKEPLLQQAQSQCRQLDEELQRVQGLLENTKKELLTQTETSGHLQRNIGVLEQEKLRVVTELQEAQAKVTQLQDKEASQAAELKTLQLKLQMQQAQWEQDKSLLQQEQEKLSSTRVQFGSMEKEIEGLQQQLKSATQQLRVVEEDRNAQNSTLEQKVRDMLEEFDTLKIQAENAQKQREHLAERERELQQQVQSLLTTNTQLTIAKAEMSRVQDQQRKEQNEFRQVIVKLEDKLKCSQQETENLQIQLQHAHFNLHSQISKYQDKKGRHKEKLCEAKEVYLRETAWRDEKIREQERELSVLAKRTEKESEMVKKVTAENEVLLLSKKQLLCQLNEEEERRRHAVATVTALQQRVDFLEKDSVRQRDLNMIKSKQIANLEGLLQDKQCLISTEDLKKLSSFENRIIEGSEQANCSERGFETFDLLAIIQKTKSSPTEEPAALTRSRASEMDYLN
ncbi:trichohyalin isoform X1 [Colossoma macropomum]|uniref:trichohyalin isoform X1 n=1 Tax=Colossoma macropomum TaxID=42526 RepID=UPI001864D1CD|nr:trichohyalin isoform X1 [Colossoma macropomum]